MIKKVLSLFALVVLLICGDAAALTAGSTNFPNPNAADVTKANTFTGEGVFYPSTNVIPLIAKSSDSGDGSTDAFQVQNHAGSVLVRASSANGYIYAYGFADVGSNVSFSPAGLALLTSGTVIYMLGESTAPGTPATGAILYVDSVDHKLKVIGKSGTITTLANP